MIDSIYGQGTVAPSPYLRFKTAKLVEDYGAGVFHPALYVVLLTAAHWHYAMTATAMVVTSLWRPDGIHKCFRAADVRVKHLYPLLAEQWEAWLNGVFVYHGAAGCQTALLHDVGRGTHLHLQVGPMEPVPKTGT